MRNQSTRQDPFKQWRHDDALDFSVGKFCVILGFATNYPEQALGEED